MKILYALAAIVAGVGGLGCSIYFMHPGPAFGGLPFSIIFLVAADNA